jgi:lipopolysaccharide/colanic/teichoic acid biosynthesis glycosyltransferase
MNDVRLSGYVPRWPVFHRLYNIVLSIVLIVAALPLMAAISLALLVTQGPGILYRGPRKGRNGTEFGILKFRTLDTARAREVTRNDVLRDGSSLETPLGGFLRATRLDELPQLFNVLLGDMNLVGPRPVRPELAEIYSKEIPHYDARFAVKPGLMGWTQALMNHGASKHVRARLNFVTCRASVRYRQELHLMLLIGSCVVAIAVKGLVRSVRRRLGFDTGRRGGLQTNDVDVAVESDDSADSWPALEWTRNEVTLGWDTPPEVGASDDSVFSLVVRLPDGHVRRARVYLRNRRPSEEGTAFEFSPSTAYSDHVVSRYMQQAVVTPHRSHLLLSRLRRRARSIVRAWDGEESGAFGQAFTERV